MQELIALLKKEQEIQGKMITENKKLEKIVKKHDNKMFGSWVNQDFKQYKNDEMIEDIISERDCSIWFHKEVGNCWMNEDGKGKNIFVSLK